MNIKRLLTGVLVLGCLAVPIASAAIRQHPAVTGFSFSPSTFAAPSSAAAAAAGGGTTVRFHLTGSPIAIRIAVARRLTGRKVGSRCVRSTSKLRTHRACTRWVSVGTIAPKNLKASDDSLRFSGRLGGHALVPGRYRATIVAFDKRHHRSKRKRTTFTVVRATSTSGQSTPPTTPAPTPPPATVSGYPNATNTGVPAGWAPKHTTNGDLTITTPGTVLDGELVTGTLYVNARNVTIRNSWIYGSINNQTSNGIDYGGMLVEDTDVGPTSGDGGATFPAVLVAGYTLRRVHVHNMSEGPRVAAFNNPSVPAADQTIDIEDSLVQIVRGTCSHNDGIQGYGEPPRTIINHNTIDARDAGPDCTTGALFIGNDSPDQLTVTNNMLGGGGFTMRIGGPGPDGPGGTYDHIAGNRIINNSWGSGPVLIDSCPTAPPIADWSDNTVVTIDANYQPTATVRKINKPC